MDLKKSRNFILVLAIAIGVAISIIFYMRFQQAPTQDILFQKEINEMKDQSSSDEIEDIEKDLEETDLSNIDSELQYIEKELENSY